MSHNPHCSGCPTCNPELFAHAMPRTLGRYEPPDSYAEALAKLRQGAPIEPTPDLDPLYNPATGHPPDPYAIALAIRKVMEEENKK
jgi:hypothetical protein